jgi:hypothetical protein
MITSAPEAISLHEKSVNEMWRGAIKGAAAAAHLRGLLAPAVEQAPGLDSTGEVAATSSEEQADNSVAVAQAKSDNRKAPSEKLRRGPSHD